MGKEFVYLWNKIIRQANTQLISVIYITDHFLHGNGTAILFRQHADVHLIINSILHTRKDFYAAFNFIRDQRHSEVQSELERRMSVNRVDLFMSHRHRALEESQHYRLFRPLRSGRFLP